MALMPVEDALALVLEDAARLGVEQVPLPQAHGRVLAADISARRTQPPAAMSAMDGYAVIADDTATPPTTLKVIGEVAAGRPFPAPVTPGTAARIFTGGVVPDGADTVVIQEDTCRDGDTIIVRQTARRGRHIRPAGVDFVEGDNLLRQHRPLSARDLALAAAMNHATLPVARKPRVALMATGDELVAPGTMPGAGQIIHSNGYALAALFDHAGAAVIDLGIIPDREDATLAAIHEARRLEVDLLVTTGGASVGDHDLILPALRKEGVSLAFWKVAMRPGKPMMHGRLGAMRVIGLPGNPVSSYVCAVLFAVPLIRALCGIGDVAPATEPARLGRAMNANDQRQDYLRASLEPAPDGGPPIATALANQDSSLLSVLAQADALLIRPPFAPAAAAGDPCHIIRLASVSR